VMARMRGRFLRVALPSPTDIGQCFSTISNTLLQSLPFRIAGFYRSNLNTAALTRSMTVYFGPGIILE
jgi:hypothetical protein